MWRLFDILRSLKTQTIILNVMKNKTEEKKITDFLLRSKIAIKTMVFEWLSVRVSVFGLSWHCAG